VNIRLFIRVLIATTAFSITSPSIGQNVHTKPSKVNASCEPALKVDSVLYAGTGDEKVDTVVVCKDGMLSGVHSFVAPQFGDEKPERTKWNYSGMLEKQEFSDLKKMMERKDIVELPPRIDVIKAKSPIDLLMTYTLVARNGMKKTITLQIPPITCHDNLEMPKPVWDLVCLFIHLQDHFKAGAAGKACGCKSLHEMAAAAAIGL
jgi:hypothetical protein